MPDQTRSWWRRQPSSHISHLQRVLQLLNAVIGALQPDISYSASAFGSSSSICKPRTISCQQHDVTFLTLNHDSLELLHLCPSRTPPAQVTHVYRHNFSCNGTISTAQLKRHIFSCSSLSYPLLELPLTSMKAPRGSRTFLKARHFEPLL